MAISFGAAAIGLVGKMPSGPGVITDELIAKIAAAVPSNINTFLLTSETNTGEIIKHHQRTGTKTIQLVDKIVNGTHDDIRKSNDQVKIVQVIHVINQSSIEEALENANSADALLLDSGNPNLSVKELGGTGRTHNWQLSKTICERSPVPVFLAGGLHAGNVADAIQSVRPYGLDLCSGVRTNGNLDAYKLEAFFKAAGY